VRIIRTDEASPNSIPDAMEKEWIYNGLDCAVTLEVLEEILPQLDNHTSRTYEFSRALQGPALEMRLRGVLIDQSRKAEVIDDYHSKIELLEFNLDRIVYEGVGMPAFNWRSHRDLQDLFYNKLEIPPIRKQGRITTDRSARDKLAAFTLAKPIVAHINLITELAKKITVLKTEIDPDGRMRTSYNIAGTSTGRFSSSFSEFGTGGNLQNIEESLRSIFIADPGMKFAKLDAKSGESFCVGAIEWNLFNDGRYLDACESGDVHTAAARIVWPNLGWTSNNRIDKDIAEGPYYRHHSYRFMCKKLGHGSNYGGQPDTLAEQSHLPVGIVKDFQPKYFRAFPSHTRWQNSVDDTLRRTGQLISLTGRKRHFFGRRSDPDILREAIAYDPQGSLADLVNTALLDIWRTRRAIISMHDHDALTWMYPEEIEDEIIPFLQAAHVKPLPLKNGRTLRIPYDCKIGWNKGDYNAKTNPDGLRDYTHGDGGRTRRPKESILNRIIRK
jgi:DNA polymerase I